jgi:hypothetical protein
MTMKFETPESTPLMEVSEIAHDGNVLVIKGTIFGSMPMTARLRPEEARHGLRLLKPGLLAFLLTFLFRRSQG